MLFEVLTDVQHSWSQEWPLCSTCFSSASRQVRRYMSGGGGGGVGGATEITDYSRTPTARTLMARLPWLFQTPS